MSNELMDNKANNLRRLLEQSKNEIAAALPSHLTPQRMARIAFTEVRKNPKLLECDPTSFIGAVIQASQLGLEPGSALGQCWMIPYFNGKTKQLEVQFQIGYKGMLALISRSADAPRIMPRAVYDGDDFNFEYGVDEVLKHKPNEKSEKLTHVYATAKFKDGSTAFMVMSAKEVESIKKRSKSADSGPWQTDYEAMALKSVIRKMFKYLPSSVEMQTAIALDEAGERGEQNNGDFIETIGKPVDATPQAPPAAFTNSIKPIQMAEEPDPVFESDGEQGAFDKFVPPTIKPTPKVHMTREQLVDETMKAAGLINIDIKKLAARVKKDFKKDLNSLTDEEIEKLLASLQAEFERMNVK
jgi:recombination protein RecT